MAEIDISERLTFIEDDPAYYLSGEQTWFSRVFTHYTTSAGDPALGRPFSLNLAELALTLPEDEQDRQKNVEAVKANGWQQAIFVGKIMTSDVQSELALAEEKSKPLEEIEKLAKAEAGFQTGLFVVQPMAAKKQATSRLKGLPPQETPQLVAGIHNNGRRSLRIVPADQDELHYGEQHGQRLKPDDIEGIDWGAIENLHRLLYDQTVDSIAAGVLDRTLLVWSKQMQTYIPKAESA
jgi:hypothetical protein